MFVVRNTVIAQVCVAAVDERGEEQASEAVEVRRDFLHASFRSDGVRAWGRPCPAGSERGDARIEQSVHG